MFQFIKCECMHKLNFGIALFTITHKVDRTFQLSMLQNSDQKNSGSVDGSGNQVATLVVGATQTTQDKTYICKVQSSEYPQSAEAQVTAPLNVYGKCLVFHQTWS